jgi:acetolactate synthase-1/2/3 large subunit
MYQEFVKQGKIIHVDIDNNELEYHRLDNRIKVNTSVDSFLDVINEKAVNYRDYTKWNIWISKIKNRYNQDIEIDRYVENKAPYRFLQHLNEITKENDIITVDVGQNEMWGAQTIKLKKGQRFVCSGGLAPMGFSLPVAIGMAFANPKKKIFCINGDGGFHMAIQSMLLISQYRLNIKVIVMNNEALGMITQFQHLYFNDNLAGTTAQGGYIIPEMSFVAKAYGFPYHQMDKDNIDDEVLSENGFDLIDYHIEGLTTVCPKLEYNKPIYMPLPQIDVIELTTSMKID